MVEGEGFLKLMNCLELGYKVPCRKFITGMIHQRYQIAKEKLLDKLDKEANLIAITTDIWTSSATEAYILSRLIISPQNGTCVLETPDMPERHTGQNIAEKLLAIVDKWKRFLLLSTTKCQTWKAYMRVAGHEMFWTLSAALYKYWS